jgi:predicted alpha/beta superfamily hydrolase
MKKIVVMLSLFAVINSLAKAQTPKVSSGTVRRIDSFPSKYVTARNVDIWLPEGYSDNKKYAVLYMHDGSMLFDSTNTWNHSEWGVDETIAKLAQENKIKDVIVVGVWNGGGTRHADYFPQKPYESLTQIEKDTVTAQLQRIGRIKGRFKPVSDNYLKFLVSELKPYIDKNFATKTDRKNTFIAGSSMGGLISMYAICEYPKVFGAAACMSTHWPGLLSMQDNPVPKAFFNYLKYIYPIRKKIKFILIMAIKR